MTGKKSTIINYSIPQSINCVLSLTVFLLMGFFLWGASQNNLFFAYSHYVCMIAFAALGNTNYSLLHESIHGIYHSNKLVNHISGIIASGYFPTSFTFHRICHLGHHRRNRTQVEIFDYYLDKKDRFLKMYQLYSLISGFYWLSIPVGCLLFLFFNPFFRSPFFIDKITKPMGLKPMVSDVTKGPVILICMEILYSVLFQISMILILNLSFYGYAGSYLFFALAWCSIQYANHAWSVRDIRNGAWNLKVKTITQYFFLNYHLHKAHHQYPKIPWIHLSDFVDKNENRPGFFRNYLKLWAGPRFNNEPEPAPISAALNKDLEY